MQLCQTVGNAVLIISEEFGGGGGGRSAEVGGRVGDGGVNGVADAGDDREGAGGDGAGDDLGVEAVEVFPGAAAAGYEDYVGMAGVGREPVDAGGDFGGAVWALHGCWIDQEIDGGVAAAADLYDVAEGGALEAGDDADAVGEGGEGALPIEEAFAAELVFELLGSCQEGAEAGLLHGLRNQLKLTASFIDGEGA